MRNLCRQLGWVGAAFAIAVLLYIPVRLMAQRCNTVFPGFYDPGTGEFSEPDDFYYWFSVAIWPAYAFFCGFIPMLAARCAGVRWWLMVPVFVVAFLVWDQVTMLDDWLGIPAGGLCGFRSYPTNLPGMNTPHLSVILCPIAFLAGAVGGPAIGWALGRRTKSGRPPSTAREVR
jgi:hypothetical protein